MNQTNHKELSVKNRRSIRALAVAAVTLVAVAPMAAGHVTVNPGEAPKGGYAALAFRVPNERDDAGTTSVVVNLPEDEPITSVRVKPQPGWTYTVEKRTLDTPIERHGSEITEVVSKITWTGGEVKPGEYEEFEISAGPLPTEVDEILFPTIQTYSNGEEVRWIDEPTDDGEEPERPAPHLTLVDPEDEGGAGGAAEGEAAGGLTVENTASQDDVDSANTLATAAVAVGVLGLLLAAFSLVKGRRA